MRSLESSNSQRWHAGWRLLGTGGAGWFLNWGVLFNGNRVSALQDEEFRRRMVVIFAQQCKYTYTTELKMVKMSAFALCILTQLKTSVNKHVHPLSSHCVLGTVLIPSHTINTSPLPSTALQETRYCPISWIRNQGLEVKYMIQDHSLIRRSQGSTQMFLVPGKHYRNRRCWPGAVAYA